MSVKRWDSNWKNEEVERLGIDVSKICNFGIKVLDDTLIGILKNDLICIGADSGVGKSEICLKIAIHNAMRGKKVALYFLEGGAQEALARIKWDLIRERYYSKGYNGIDMDYRKWRMNMIKDPLINKLEEECLLDFESKVGDNFFLYDNPLGLTIEDFIESLGYFLKPQGHEDDFLNYKHDVDLIIIDHLQYFTLTNPKNELTEQTQILKKVNEICHNFHIPVILASHLRKKERDRGLPGQEDFYGTSNVPKMSSISLTLSSENSEDGIIYPTYFRYVKSRTKLSSNFALRSDFNLIKGKYSDDYYCYSLFGDKLSENPLSFNKLPKFAKGAKLLLPSLPKESKWQD